MKAFPRLDVLPAAQKRLWPDLAAVKNEAALQQHFELDREQIVQRRQGSRESSTAT